MDGSSALSRERSSEALTLAMLLLSYLACHSHSTLRGKLQTGRLRLLLTGWNMQI